MLAAYLEKGHMRETQLVDIPGYDDEGTEVMPEFSDVSSPSFRHPLLLPKRKFTGRR